MHCIVKINLYFHGQHEFVSYVLGFQGGHACLVTPPKNVQFDSKLGDEDGWYRDEAKIGGT